MADNKNSVRLGEGVADDLKQSINQGLSDVEYTNRCYFPICKG